MLIYTNTVRADEIDHTVAGTAHLFQQQVDKAYEVRLTIVDEQFFAVRIDTAGPAAALDWRRDYDSLTYAVSDVPDQVRAAVRRLLAHLRLRFAALDFIVTPRDEWIFLEVNPNGQWAWLQDATGLPIAAAIADALTKEPA